MKLSTFKSSLISAGLFAATVFATGTASAAPIVNWDYTVSSAFVTTAGATTFNGTNGCQSVGATAISWGACPSGPAVLGGNRSGIGISNTPQSGTIITNGAVAPANTYTHTNNSLAGTLSTLTSAKIRATLGLRPTGSGAAFTSYSATYDIDFSETRNQAPCAVVTSPTPCNDIWVLHGSLNNSFTIGTDQYFFSFFASPALTALTPATCAAAGSASPCTGFTTVEDRTNAVNFVMRITSTPLEIPGQVPEPASIALMGIGLVCIAGLRTRRRNPKV